MEKSKQANNENNRKKVTKPFRFGEIISLIERLLLFSFFDVLFHVSEINLEQLGTSGRSIERWFFNLGLV